MTMNSDHFEPEPEDLEVGISIQHLRKVFGDFVAVKDLTLNMYKGQVRVLLFLLIFGSFKINEKTSQHQKSNHVSYY